VGALLSKFIAGPILRRFGFRRVLVWNTYVTALSFLLLTLAIAPGTPHALLALVIFFSGAARSLQFTGINAIGYPDIQPQRMSRASTLQAVFQQCSVATGVAIGAAILHVSIAAHGAHVPGLTDFRWAFAACVALTLASERFFWALSTDAGAAVSGHGMTAE